MSFPLSCPFFSFPVQVYSIFFFFHAVTTILYIYRLRVWRILYFHASLRSVFKYQLLLLFFTSLVWFFHMLANQMRILRINGVYYHKNGHMCVIEVERKITSLFYVILCIYFWNEAYLANARVCTGGKKLQEKEIHFIIIKV